MSVLDRGGNAIDAAVAGAFVLHVVEPHLNGPGGDATILISVRGATPLALCGQGTAPSGASAAAYRDLGLDLVPGTGPLAAAIPGAVDAWLLALRDHGTWRFADVLSPAIAVAEQGHYPLARIGDVVERMRGHFTEHWPTSAEFYLTDPPRPDRLWRNPTLAATWRRLIEESTSAASDAEGRREREIDAAREIWKTGFHRRPRWSPLRSAPPAIRAGTITRVSSATTTSRAGRRPGSRRSPIRGPHGPSTRPVLDPGAGVPAATGPARRPGARSTPTPSDPAVVHRLIEGAKLALADRDAWYGDSAPLPPGLLGEEYSSARRDLIGPYARTGWRPGSPDGVEPTPAAHIARLLGGDVVPVRTPVPANRPSTDRASTPRGSPPTARPEATPATSRSPTGGEPSSPRPRRAGGCSRTPSSPNSGSRSARDCRCAGSTRAAQLLDTRSAAPQHPEPHDRRVRGPGRAGFRHPGRRPAGPMDVQHLRPDGPRSRRAGPPRPAVGDRGAAVAHRPPHRLLLAPRIRAHLGVDRGRRRRSIVGPCVVADTTCTWHRRRRSDACAWSGAIPARGPCSREPAPAGARGTPPDAEPGPTGRVPGEGGQGAGVEFAGREEPAHPAQSRGTRPGPIWPIPPIQNRRPTRRWTAGRRYGRGGRSVDRLARRAQLLAGLDHAGGHACLTGLAPRARIVHLLVADLAVDLRARRRSSSSCARPPGG